MASLNSLLSGGVKSVQRGVMTSDVISGVTFATVAAVNPAKTVLIVTGWSQPGTSNAAPAASLPRVELISATQIRIVRENAGTVQNPVAVAWQLVEYY